MKADFERPEILVFSFRVNTFASHLKIIFMRKLFIMMMAFLLPVSALEMRADETKVDKILKSGSKGKIEQGC